MKRPLAAVGDINMNKKLKQQEEEMSREAEAVLLHDNLLFEVLKHVDDGRTLASAACVSRQWKRTAQDERLWELICTKHYNSTPLQLRVVVLALGGFRRLYSSHLWPLLRQSSSSSSSSSPSSVSAWPCLPPAPAERPRSKARWGRDEVNLSLSLLSIKYFEKMSFNRGK
ncbi:F-box protein GID2-like [Olea europaea var. sylvestris]|uniref:F-box protein GID2-like n=1 Tax=Olea europaea var. sylvestris TaxID=158386 RepID=UPI000C1D14C2|nr:F-box protein GID2-like [Olea europaea var. sylvestris]